ncbi:hypothetical protein BST61_g3665 [Cercospora zeina]
MSDNAPQPPSNPAAVTTAKPKKTKSKKPPAVQWIEADVETLMSMRAQGFCYDAIRIKLNPLRSNMACRLMVNNCTEPEKKSANYHKYRHIVDPYRDAIMKRRAKKSGSKTAGKEQQKPQPDLAQNITADTNINANTDTALNANTDPNVKTGPHINDGKIPEQLTATQPGIPTRAAATLLPKPSETDKTEEDTRMEEENEPVSPVAPHQNLSEFIEKFQRLQRDFTYKGHVPGLSNFVQSELASKGKTYRQCVQEYKDHIARVESTRVLTREEKWGLYSSRAALQAAEAQNVHDTVMEEGA